MQARSSPFEARIAPVYSGANLLNYQILVPLTCLPGRCFGGESNPVSGLEPLPLQTTIPATVCFTSLLSESHWIARQIGPLPPQS